MATFKLTAEPTFQAPVMFPLAGGAPVRVMLTFRHRKKEELQKFLDERSNKVDVDAWMDFVAGWDLEEPHSRENVETLLANHIPVALAAFEVYLDQLVGARTKR